MTVFRRTESREGMDIHALVTFHCSSIAEPPFAKVRLIAPLYPDVIEATVRLPDELFSLDKAADSLARQCVDIAWNDNLDEYYDVLKAEAAEGQPMDAISLYYRKHLREEMAA